MSAKYTWKYTPLILNQTISYIAEHSRSELSCRWGWCIPDSFNLVNMNPVEILKKYPHS